MNYPQLNQLELVSILPEAASRLVRSGESTSKLVDEESRLSERSSFAVAALGGEITPAICASLREWMHAARVNPQVETAVLKIRSAGGFAEGVAETFEFGLRLAKEKPFVVLGEGYLCSAAYHIAASASKIFASPSCVVGSCGVISVLFDNSELFRKMGIKVIPVTTGPAKGIGLPGVEVTEDMVARVKRRIDGIQIGFKKDLRRAGRMTAQQREDAFEDADVYRADEAKQRGYIDEVMIPEDYFHQSDEKLRRTQFVHLVGNAADEKFEKLVCKAAGVDAFYDADDADVERVRAKYPVLARHRDEHLSRAR